MIFDYSDHQGFFAKICEINKKYLVSADANIKLLEGYTQENAIEFMVLLKNAYTKLIKAIEPIDILSGKTAMDYYLKEYIKELQGIISKTYITLIILRWNELKICIFGKIRADVQGTIDLKISGLGDKEKTIDQRIGGLKETFDFIEKYCKKHSLG